MDTCDIDIGKVQGNCPSWEGTHVLGGIKGHPPPSHLFSSSSFLPLLNPLNHHLTVATHETAQVEGAVAHGACTPMLRPQHYPIAESHTIYLMPTKLNTSSRASPSVKSWFEHLGSIAIGGPTEHTPSSFVHVHVRSPS